MSERLIAIGDMHGCLAALETLLSAVAPGRHDTIVTLGDYVDRGPDSRGVLETLMALSAQTNLVPLLGNHDAMMLEACGNTPEVAEEWLMFGGDATLASYGAKTARDILPSHREFVAACRTYYETDKHIFIHANYSPHLPLAEQPRVLLLWESLKRFLPGPHFSGKTVVLGHTAQKTGEILDLGYMKCIDTWCYGDGWLTALDVLSGKQWQANKAGKMRS